MNNTATTLISPPHSPFLPLPSLSLIRYIIRPKVLVDVSVIDMSVTLLGDHRIDFPIGISPTGFQCMAHPEGEKATARGICIDYVLCWNDFRVLLFNYPTCSYTGDNNGEPLEFPDVEGSATGQ